MKLHDALAPNAWRVQAFIKEKGIDIPRQTISVVEGDTRKPDFLAINSLGEVPVLELDDGTRITESVAICRYLESLHPTPALFGTTPLAQAQVEMWNRRMEQQIFGYCAQFGLHMIPFFADKIEQMPEYAETQRRMLAKKWAWLDTELADGRPFIAGDAMSVADITGATALIICGFMDLEVPANAANVQRWADAMRERPSWALWQM